VIDEISQFIDSYLRGNWTSIIDILLVAFVIYWLFILIRGTRAVRIVIGLALLYLVYLAALFFGFDLLRRLMETAAVVGLFAVVVVFQPELRRARAAGADRQREPVLRERGGCRRGASRARDQPRGADPRGVAARRADRARA
jgi:DNA integrity scanning protein DisA with diadenylate cyclase activity